MCIVQGKINQILGFNGLERMLAESIDHQFSFEVAMKKDADIEGSVKVIDLDNLEIVRLNGWLWTFEKL